MVASAIPRRATFERAAERIYRVAKSARVHADRARRRQLADQIPRNPELVHVVDHRLGYAKLPLGSIRNVGPAVEFAQKTLKERRQKAAARKKKSDYLPLLLQGVRYEDAPPLFNLVLGDDILQIATEYLGEIPILLRLKLLWSPVNDKLTGSQLYHVDGNRWLHRRAKFVFNLNDVDECAGPFTFLPADVSRRVADGNRGMTRSDRQSDDDVYRFAKPEDAISVVGPAGTGAMVDTSQCLHYGSRARGKERLALIFQFVGRIDTTGNQKSTQRSLAFAERYGDDPVRKLVVPYES